MPFQIVHNDITKMNTDAIVNAANSVLQQGGGVCGAIFQEAGEEQLRNECNSIGHCPVGHAIITRGYRLKAKYIIHAVGPIWNSGNQEEAKFLAMAYRNSLKLARQNNLSSISLPLISTGVYGYPKEEALQIAIMEISDFLMQNEMDVYLVVFDRKSISLSEKLFSDINHYIDTYYEDTDDHAFRCQRNYESIGIEDASISYSFEAMPRSLEDIVDHLEETFSEMMLRLIIEKDKTDVEVYKKANMDRKLFSKIRSNKDYQPKKSTALSLAISLELSLDETIDLLMKAGYSLSMSNKFDVIVKYFIENKRYDLFEINEALFFYEQPLLGV